jgi:hypothetical protein
MAERVLYDTAKKARELRRLVDLIPPPGEEYLQIARETVRRAGIKPPGEREPSEQKNDRPFAA